MDPSSRSPYPPAHFIEVGRRRICLWRVVDTELTVSGDAPSLVITMAVPSFYAGCRQITLHGTDVADFLVLTAHLTESLDDVIGTAAAEDVA